MVNTPLHGDAGGRSVDRFGPLRRWQVASTVVLLVLSAVAAALGLFLEGFYRDPEVLLPQLYGQDVVTLLVGVPLLAVGLWAATRGSVRGYVVWLGALGYLLYTWATYVAMLSFNEFFLGYVALFSLSLFTFVGATLDAPAETVAGRLEGGFPVAALVGYVGLTAALVGVAWLSEIVPATLRGEVPETIVRSELPTNLVYVLDLGVLVPAAAVVGWWLWTGRTWGYVLGGVLLVKLATLGLAVVAMVAQMHVTGQEVSLALAGVFGALTLAAVVLGALYLRALGSGGGSGGSRGSGGSGWEPLGRS